MVYNQDEVKQRTKVETIIVSDIHLGSSACRSQLLLRTLDSFDCRRLILNGDIFDDLNLKRLNSEHWDVLSFLRHYSKYHEVVWIVGNHDGGARSLSQLMGVKIYKKYYWTFNGKRCLALHGNQFNRFLSRNIIISWLLDFIYIKVIQKFDTKRGAISNWIRNNKKWLRLSHEVASGALAYARFHRANYVFCGHTHQAMTDERDGIKYFNSGSWAEVPSHYILLNNRQVKLVQVD